VLQLISKYGLAGRVTWEGALAPEMTLERMRNATVFVLPSVGEVMPMSVLEAMSLGLPVVVTDSNGLAIPLTNSGAGVVVDETLNGLVSGVRRLLDSAKLRAELGTAARRLIQDEYSITAVASALETIYTDTIKASQPNTEEKL
jgi:glycosyltransferase involved in cell wall biosynthesis